ncbi:MAG: hypothetical protein ABIR70_13350 [Bryobacteraceae bacterium]
MVERIDIERALEDLISNEGGMRFQGLAVVLAKIRWPELIACERHNDLGLDAYAHPMLAPDQIGKGLACSTTATFSKLNSDAKSAKEHYGPISVLIFATPGKVSKDSEKKWADKIRTAHGFVLVVISREEIITLLQFPDNAWICRTHLKISVPYKPSDVDSLRQVREAGAVVAAEWAAHPRLAGKPKIDLNTVVLDEQARETRATFATPHLRTLLLRGRRLVLEAPAGRGKTTTLIQLAQADGILEGIPQLIDLPRWVRSGLDILEYVARSPAFRARGIDAGTLSRLGQAEPYLFLLNGWNEISDVHSVDAANALRELERTFPAAGIIVATRTHHILPPLPGATRIRLLPLTSAQRFSYLEQVLGETLAHELHLKLSRDGVLDDLTRTPFILAEVTAIFRLGREIPRTKLRLLEEVIGLVEQSDDHRANLQDQPLWGRAQDYLSALAIPLTAQGEVILGESAARIICHAASERLQNARQISGHPEPSQILNALSSHHVLERVEYPSISFRFEHQQFQECYAARGLKDLLRQAVASGNPDARYAFAKGYINEPAWEEPLRMIAQDLGDALDDVVAGTLLVQAALIVDPVFAARLSQLAGPHVCKEVGGGINSRLRQMYARTNSHYQRCALAAMLASGSEEFADVLIPLLTHADQQVRLATYRAGSEFHLSILGPEWQTVVATWPEQQRLEFVSELTTHQGKTEVASAFARTDPSPAVRLEALRALSWVGQLDEVTEVLGALSDQQFDQAVQKLHPDEIPPSLRARSAASYRALLTAADDPKLRFQISLTLADLNDAETPARLKAELIGMPPATVKEISDYILRPAAEILQRTDPQWLSEWVTNRVIDGTLWRDNWVSLMSEAPLALCEQILGRARTGDLRHNGGGGSLAVLRATTDPAVGKAVFAALRDHHQELIADPQNEQKQAIDFQLRGLLRGISRSVLVEGLADLLAQLPQDDHLAILAELFSGMGTVEDDASDTLPEGLRQCLRVYFKAAVTIVLDQDDLRGETKARLSCALAEVGNLEDLPDLVAMMRQDINRVRAGRAAMARAERSGRAQGGYMSWSGWHTHAVVRLAGREAERILFDMLREPEYELDAAWGLQVIAKHVNPGPNPIMAARFAQPTLDYKAVGRALSNRSAIYDAALRVRYADAIRDRILNLFGESKDGDHKRVPYHHRLKELAKVLAALDAESSADLIMTIAELPAQSDGWLRIALLENLVGAGVVLPLDRVLGIIAPVLDQFRKYSLNNDHGLLNRLLCILPFVDAPALGIERMRAIIAEFRLHHYQQRHLLMAVSACSDEAGLTFLLDFARESDAGFPRFAKEWLEAIAANELPSARAVLWTFIDPTVKDDLGDRMLPDYALDFLAGRLTDLARAEVSFSERIVRLCAQPISGQRRMILAKIVSWLGSSQALLAGLALIDDTSLQPMPYELRRALEDVFMEKRPYNGNPQSYTLVPRAATDIKERLFELARNDPRRAQTAYNLLAQIEEWRLEYGRPASEPRHPRFDSGEHWPPLTLVKE